MNRFDIKGDWGFKIFDHDGVGYVHYDIFIEDEQLREYNTYSNSGELVSIKRLIPFTIVNKGSDIRNKDKIYNNKFSIDIPLIKKKKMHYLVDIDKLKSNFIDKINETININLDSEYVNHTTVIDSIKIENEFNQEIYVLHDYVKDLYVMLDNRQFKLYMLLKEF